MPYRMQGPGTRDELRETFDRVARLYDQARPSYPAQLFEDVAALAGLRAGSRLFEIGCGTGHATQEFAARGFPIDCVELGASMALVARQRLARFPNVRIEIADFDRWTTERRYDLVYSATAYHWLDPATREQNAARVLKPSGWLAFWRNRHIRNGSSDAFLDEAKEIYAAEAPELMAKRVHLATADEALEQDREDFSTLLFAGPIYRVYFWSRRYSAGGYVRMLATHSDYQLLAAASRQRLLDGIEHLIDTRYGGSIVKDHATVLQMARRKS